MIRWAAITRMGWPICPRPAQLCTLLHRHHPTLGHARCLFLLLVIAVPCLAQPALIVRMAVPSVECPILLRVLHMPCLHICVMTWWIGVVLLPAYCTVRFGVLVIVVAAIAPLAEATRIVWAVGSPTVHTA